MSIKQYENLTLLEADFIEAVNATVPKRYNGSADYFTELTGRLIDTRDYDLGDRKHLKNSIRHRLNNTYEKSGKKKTGWGYKKDVLPVIQKALRHVNK
ncbi:TPA: hypothetical protein N3B91_004425 [Vibrio parahaemolyticus]|nr:hypothetical protein [Vibrio parahaemolyticus]